MSTLLEWVGEVAGSDGSKSAGSPKGGVPLCCCTASSLAVGKPAADGSLA